jgi:hypothetical protein
VSEAMNKVFIVYGDGGEGCGIVSTDCFRARESAEVFKAECERGDYADKVSPSYRQKADEFFKYAIVEYLVR